MFIEDVVVGPGEMWSGEVERWGGVILAAQLVRVPHIAGDRECGVSCPGPVEDTGIAGENAETWGSIERPRGRSRGDELAPENRAKTSPHLPAFPRWSGLSTETCHLSTKGMLAMHPQPVEWLAVDMWVAE